MKTFQILALFCLIIYTYQKCEKYNAKKEDCKTENFDETEKKTAKYCCFKKGGLDDDSCEAFSEYRYKHIKDVIKLARLNGNGEDYSIDCKSLYLQISALSLLLILL